MGCGGSSAAGGSIAAAPAKEAEPVKEAETDARRSRSPHHYAREGRESGEEKKKKKEKAKELKKKDNSGMMDALALQFPNISKSFRSLYDNFNKCSNEGEGFKKIISRDKIREVLQAMCKEKEFTDEEAMELFNIADMDGSKGLTFREFLISMAMGYYLKVQSDDPGFRQIQKGFRVVEKAFKDMDADKGGSIDTAELKTAMFATANSRDLEVLEARFKELDFDGDGDIMLPEFMYGMVSWVGFADDLDEEEAENAAAE